MKKIYPFLCILILLFSSCRLSDRIVDSKSSLRYKSTFENAEMQQQFEAFTASVIRLTIFVSYQTQIFEPDSLVNLSELASGIVLGAVHSRFVQNESFSGTATVIAVNSNKAFLLACAHNVNFPDTVFTYNDRADNFGNRYLLGISVKTGEVIQASCPAGILHACVLELNTASDLALLEVSAENALDLPFPISLKLAAVKELHWGDRLWMVGYPSGRFMMTTGIISNPGNNEGVLLTDAPFSEGFSGAPALVYDQETDKFLLAGIGRSVAAQTQYVLKPEKKMHEAVYNAALPYEGTVYVDIEKQPVAGITFITSSDLLMKFFNRIKNIPGLPAWGAGVSDTEGSEKK